MNEAFTSSNFQNVHHVIKKLNFYITSDIKTDGIISRAGNACYAFRIVFLL